MRRGPEPLVVLLAGAVIVLSMVALVALVFG